MQYGCSLPQDPEDTLNSIQNGTLRAGIVNNPPWTIWNKGEPYGIEVEILKGIAKELNSEIKWKKGSEEKLFSALEHGDLDIVLSGLTKSSPWVKHVGPSNPFLETRLTIGLPNDLSPKYNLKEIKIAVPFGSPRAHLLKKKGYKIEEVDSIKKYNGPVCAYEYELESLNKNDSGIKINIEKHILPVKKGENAWLVYIENYCRKNEKTIKNYLENLGK